MFDTTGVEHHPVISEIVDVLCAKTQTTDRSFFTCEVAYFISKIASNMRAVIITKDRGEIPVNAYALALATSGFGKGHSVSIIENDFMKMFQRRFMQDTLPVITEQSLWKLANQRAARSGKDAQEEFDAAQAEWNQAGAFPFTFDSGTPPAVKQLRHKLLLSACGAINLQIDEIGSNLIGSTDLLTLFLELFDQGMVKQKLTKNTADNKRGEELDGKTPTNMLLFGTPSKLFDGSQTEDQFYSFLETGYARRCLFGFGYHHHAYETQTPAEIFAKLIQPGNSATINKWANQFHKLADPAMWNWKMDVKDPVAIQLLTYKIDCEKRATELPEHEEIRKSELNHRYFKALKLAGAFAFVDESTEIEMDHLMSAILLVEESGKNFLTILSREKAYVKLAKYIAAVGEDVTHADLHEALPFYKAGNAARNEAMTLATAWGYKNNIIIKKSFVDGIEFFRGETLEETDLSKMIVSYSDHWAYNYLGETVPFDQLGPVLMQQQGFHWSNHHFKNLHRSEENVIPGFNMIVLDVDGGVKLEVVHELLKEYKFLTYTTKRHTPENHRFRLVMPINYHLELDSNEYKEFMNCVMSWLPFKIDDASNQRSKKWECYGGEGAQLHYNLEAEFLDALDFIPKTSRNESFKNQNSKLDSLDNLERWFAQRIAMGNRNNNMVRFALALVDSGMPLLEVSESVTAFNQKLNNPLSQSELDSTVMVTVAKRYTAA